MPGCDLGEGSGARESLGGIQVPWSYLGGGHFGSLRCRRVTGSTVWETSRAFGARFGVPHAPLPHAALQPCSQRSPPHRGTPCWAPPRPSPPPLPAPAATLPTVRSPSAWGSAALAGSTRTSTPRGCCACGPAWSSRHGSDGVSAPPPLSPSLLPAFAYSPGGPRHAVPLSRGVQRISGIVFLFGTPSCPPGTRSGGWSCSAQHTASCLQAVAFLALLVPFPAPTSPLSSHPSAKPSPVLSVGLAHCSPSYFPPQNPAG